MITFFDLLLLIHNCLSIRNLIIIVYIVLTGHPDKTFDYHYHYHNECHAQINEHLELKSMISSHI